MRLVFIIIILSFIFIKPFQAQIMYYEWAKHAGGEGSDFTYTMDIDLNGNIYCGGTICFRQHSSWSDLFDAYFDDIIVSPIEHGMTGYFAMYTPDGKVEWVKTPDNKAFCSISSLRVDSMQNIYVSGYFEDYISFDGQGISSMKNYDLYYARFDENGFINWILPGNVYGDGHDPDMDLNMEHVAISGRFTDHFLFLGEDTLSGGYQYNAFISLLDKDGSVHWWKTFQANNDHGNGYFGNCKLCLDEESNVYFGGWYSSDHLISDDFSFTGGQHYHCSVMAKYNSTGGFQWAINFRNNDPGSQNAVRLLALDLYSNGDVFLLGEIRGSANIGNYLLETDVLSDFMARISPQGQVLWARIVSDNFKFISKTDIDREDNIYFAGSFYNTITLGDTTLTSNGDCDIVCGMINSDFEFPWAISSGGLWYDVAKNIKCTNQGDCYTVGRFECSTIIGNTQMESYGDLSCFYGLKDIFLTHITEGNEHVEDFQSELKCGVYPNPSTGQFNIDIEDPEEKEFHFRLYTLSGVQLYIDRFITSDNLGESSFCLDLASFDKGLYVLQINGTKSTKYVKLVRH